MLPPDLNVETGIYSYIQLTLACLLIRSDVIICSVVLTHTHTDICTYTQSLILHSSHSIHIIPCTPLFSIIASLNPIPSLHPTAHPQTSPSIPILTLHTLASSTLSTFSPPNLSTTPYLILISPLSALIPFAEIFPSNPSNTGAANARAISSGCREGARPCVE